MLHAYAWAAPQLGTLSLEILQGHNGRAAVLLRGAATRPRIVIGSAAGVRSALEDALHTADALRAALDFK